MKKSILTTVLFFIFILTQNIKADNRPYTTPDDSTKNIGMEEIVIVATPKENDRLRQQASSSSSFSKGTLQELSIRSVKDLSGTVPNLFIPDYGSKLTTSVYVRGVGSRINTPAVGLYVDNIPFIDKSAFDFNYSDIERIDVLHGPQATLYGRNTMGGLIRIFTKSPFSYQGTDVNLRAATYNNYKTSFTHYHRLSEKFAFSAGGFYEHKGGFFRNSFHNDKRVDKSDEAGGRIRAVLFPTDRLRLDFILNYEYLNQGGYPYMYTGVTEGEEDRPGNIGRIAYGNDCSYQRNLVNAGANIEYQAGQFILSSITGFQYLHDKMNLDQDFTEQNIYTLRQRQDAQTVTQEIILKAKSGQKWQWVTGASGFYQALNTQAPVTFHEDGIKNLIEGNINGILSSLPENAPDMKMTINTCPLPIGSSFDTPIWNVAIYHQSTINDILLKGLSVTLGLRLDYEKLRLDYRSFCDMNFRFGVTPPNFPAEIAKDLNAASHFTGKESTDYLQLSPKFTLQYSWNKQNNVYATISKGYRSGGYNIQMFSELVQGDLKNATLNALKNDELFGNFSGIFPETAPSGSVTDATLYEPEYAWNYEIGSHLTSFNGKLAVDLALFYMDIRNQQLSRFSENGLGRITVNAGKSRSMGGEANVSVQLTEAFRLNGNYGYTYATFTDYVMEEEKNTFISYNGNYVPFVPKHTFQLAAQYVLRLKQNRLADNIAFQANVKGAGRIYWTERNDVSQRLYETLNGRIEINKGKRQIALWVNNILNTHYKAFYFETMQRGFAQEGRPVQAGIDIRLQF